MVIYRNLPFNSFRIIFVLLLSEVLIFQLNRFLQILIQTILIIQLRKSDILFAAFTLHNKTIIALDFLSSSILNSLLFWLRGILEIEFALCPRLHFYFVMRLIFNFNLLLCNLIACKLLQFKFFNLITFKNILLHFNN